MWQSSPAEVATLIVAYGCTALRLAPIDVVRLVDALARTDCTAALADDLPAFSWMPPNALRLPRSTTANT